MGDENDWWRLFEGADDPSPDAPKTAIRRSRGRPRTRNPPPFEVPPHVIERMRRRGPGNITKEQCKQNAEEARRDGIGWGMFRASKRKENTANNNRQVEKRRRIAKLYSANEDIILGPLSVYAVAKLILGRETNLGLGDRALRGYITWIRAFERKWRAGRAK